MFLKASATCLSFVLAVAGLESMSTLATGETKKVVRKVVVSAAGGVVTQVPRKVAPGETSARSTKLQASEVADDGNEALKPLYIHVHIPTSGGRSLEEAMRHAGWKLRSPPSGYGVHQWTAEDAAFLTKACDDDTVDMIAGHVSFKEIEPILQSGACKRPTRIITVLREPVKHGESWLKDQLSSEDIFKAFQDRKHHIGVLQNIENRMAYQLGDFSKLDRRSQKTADVLERAKKTLDSSFFVFFLDNFENDFHAFAREVGLKDVTLPLTESQRNPRTLTASDEEEIKKLNALDIELYQWAHERFARI